MDGETASRAGCGAPRSSQQPLRLLDLPANVQATIVQKAGLHARQVCSAFRDLHPPLLSLTPHGLPTFSALNAAVVTLPPSLTALDLKHLLAPYHTSFFDHPHLAAICSYLPHLQSLTLPHTPDPGPPAGLADLDESIALLPRLHTLHILPATCGLLRKTWLQLQQPPIAARLQSLSLPGDTTKALLAVPPATFPHLTSLRLHELRRNDRPRTWSAACFAALSAVLPALQSLELDVYIKLGDDAPLATVKVTALKLGGCCCTGQPPAPLLQHIGTLTHLRSLSLALEHRGFTPPEAGWLSRLTQLTRLAVALHEYDDDEDAELPPPFQVAPWAQGAAHEPVSAMALALASVARDAAQLPLLQDLKLGVPYWLAVSDLEHRTPHSFLHYLPTATQLRRLWLAGVRLPPSQSQRLSNLQQLSCLHVNLRAPPLEAPGIPGQAHPCDGPIGLGWISTLQGLQQLQVLAPDGGQCGPLQAALTGLTGLHTLGLPCLPCGHDLAAVLLHFQGTLVRVDLRDLDTCHLPALPVLGVMSRLQVLDLATFHQPVELAPHLRLPGSLRRCYLHPVFHSGSGRRLVHLVPDQHAVVVEWRQQYPLVDFCMYNRPDKHVW